MNWRNLPGADRRNAPATEPAPDCGRCHKLDGETWVRVIVGVGKQRLHPACERVLTSMGYDVREDRRRA